MRRAYYLGGTLLILVALAVVPLPLLVLSPGSADPVGRRLELTGGDLEPVHGEVLLTTVAVAEASALAVARAIVDPRRDLVARQVFIPTGHDAPSYFQAQRELFAESSRVAVAAGLRQAGRPVETTGRGARVEALAPEVADERILREGDVIVEADGRPVAVAADLVALLARHRAGDTVTLVVERGDDRAILDVAVRQLDEPPRPGLGAALSTVGFELRLPVDVRVDAEGIGGPSGGLATALVTYDAAARGDLLAGRRVAATGTVDLAGQVGPVGGVTQKVAAAERAGADLFLVPLSEEAEARAAAGTIEIVAVGTVAEAVAALQR